MISYTKRNEEEAAAAENNDEKSERVLQCLCVCAFAIAHKYALSVFSIDAKWVGQAGGDEKKVLVT